MWSTARTGQSHRATMGTIRAPGWRGQWLGWAGLEVLGVHMWGRLGGGGRWDDGELSWASERVSHPNPPGVYFSSFHLFLLFFFFFFSLPSFLPIFSFPHIRTLIALCIP